MLDHAMHRPAGQALNVLMLSPQFSPLVGGYERAAERLAAALAARPDVAVVEVVTERRESAWPRAETRAGFSIRRLWCCYRPRLHVVTSGVALAWYLLRSLRRFDVVHIHQYGYPAAIAIVLAKLLRRPVVLKITSTGADGITSALHELRGGRGLIAWLHRDVDVCAATTKDAAQEAEQFGIPKQRVRIVPNGVDTREFCPGDSAMRTDARERAGLGPGPTAIYCGRLSAEKNAYGLVRAWRVVADAVPGAVLVVVGDGPLKETLANAIRAAALEGVVRLMGAQTDVAPWYQMADLFVLPSNHEGLSNSLLEAMSCGLPIVATRVSGSSEILGEIEAGILVDVGDEAGLASAMIAMLTSPERRRICGGHARRYVEQKYTLSVVAEQVVRVYQELAAAGRR
jgi:glycosyltransferase involved in cell wall biosynthesis